MKVNEAKELSRDIDGLGRKVDKLGEKISHLEVHNSRQDSHIDNLYRENKQILKAIAKQGKKSDKKSKYIYKKLSDSDEKLEKVNMRWNLVLGGATVLFFLIQFLDLSRLTVK